MSCTVFNQVIVSKTYDCFVQKPLIGLLGSGVSDSSWDKGTHLIWLIFTLLKLPIILS